MHAVGAFVAPESLPAFLDRGGDLAEVLGRLDRIVELVGQVEELDGEAIARVNGWLVEAALSGDPVMVPKAGGPVPVVASQQQLTGLAWEVEIARDPSLAERVYAVLPEAARRAVDRERERCRRPHPLRVARAGEPVTSRRCRACGTVFAPGEAVMVVGHRVDEHGRDYSEPEPYPRAWCSGCVTQVAEALKAAR